MQSCARHQWITQETKTKSLLSFSSSGSKLNSTLVQYKKKTLHQKSLLRYSNCNILSHRKQRTVLNGQSSNWGDISAGVPQGSILGPLFFLVYVNDLAVGLKCNVKLFADDTSLFTVVEDSNTAANDMNHDLDLISQWAHTWRMSFNPDPQKQAVELTFSRKKIEIDHPVILFNNIPVKKVVEHKHLGLSWTQSYLSQLISNRLSPKQGRALVC